MTGMWLAAVALLVLALLFVVPPLLRAPARQAIAREAVARRLHGEQLAQIEKDFRSGALDQRDREQAIDELRRQALEEASLPAAQPGPAVRPWMAWGVAGGLSVALPVAALLLYLQVGNPRALAEQAHAASQAGTHRGGGNEMEQMVSRLALRLQSQADDVEGWIVLARSYEFLQRYDDAVVAYRKAMALAPDQPQLLADYADALASARGGDLSGPVQEAIAAALAIDADNPKALALAGMAAFKRGDLPLARLHWQHLQALLPPDSEMALRVGADLARMDAAPNRRVGGTVDIASSLKDKASPQDTVFVVAKAAESGRMPVAVLRLQVKDLPARFVLDDSLAMSPDRPISRFDFLTIEVRITRSGQAAPQPGDLAGSVAGVSLGQEGVALVADRLLR